MPEGLKESNTVSVRHTGGSRAGSTYKMLCPYCNYKQQTYSTVFLWDRVIVGCESCNEDYVLINTDRDSRKTNN